jgi:hypothetical protein
MFEHESREMGQFVGKIEDRLPSALRVVNLDLDLAAHRSGLRLGRNFGSEINPSAGDFEKVLVVARGGLLPIGFEVCFRRAGHLQSCEGFGKDREGVAVLSARRLWLRRDFLVNGGDLIGEGVNDLVQQPTAGGVAIAKEEVADARNQSFGLAQALACVGQFRRCQHEILSGKAPPFAESWGCGDCKAVPAS